MKTKFVTICLLLFLSVNTKAAFTETNIDTQQPLSVAEQNEQFSHVYAMTDLNRKDYEQLIGRHLSLVERIGLKLAQHRLKKELKQYEATGVMPQKLFNNYLAPRKGSSVTIILLVVVIVLLLLLLVPLALIGKWN